MQTPRDTYRQAVEDLAQDFVRREWRDAINEKDALPYVDKTTVEAWKALQIACPSDPEARPNGSLARLSLLTDALEMADEADLDLLTSCLFVDTHTVRDTLAELVTRLCVRDVIYDAELRVNELDPGDSEDAASYYPSLVDDPVLADRTALARRLG